MKIKTFQKQDVYGKKVFLRLDFDVPIENGSITDDSRLKAGLSSINSLLKNNCFLVLAGHLGRPDHHLEKRDEFSLKPIADWFKRVLEISDDKFKKGKLKELEGWSLGEKAFILENLRFNKGEEENDFNFSKKLSSLSEIYINDAFAVSHRNHASITGITKILPSFAGLRLTKEIEVLSKVLKNPKRPLTVIIGGAKIETKLPLIAKMHKFANFVLVGGEVAKHTNELIKVEHQKAGYVKSIIEIADLIDSAKDINEYSINNFLKIIYQSNTIIWNGPMGEFEKGFNKGTKEIAFGIIKAKAKSIVGGGDTVGYLKRLNLLENFSFVSTGGGAMLDFLSGEKLPGLEVLKK